MRNLLAFLATLAWGLWLGGTIALFIFVSTLFKADRSIAIEAAPRVFLVFERYQLILAFVAVTATFFWRMIAPSKWITSLFFLLALASFAAVASAGLITPKMERIRAAGGSGGPEFRRLHGMSMMMYTSAAGMLLVAGIILQAAIRATRRKDPETAAGKETRDVAADRSLTARESGG